MPTVKPIPDGYHTVTPGLTIDGCAGAIELYKKALAAEQRGVVTAPDGKVMHAEVKVGDSILMLNDPFPGASPTTSSFYLYVKDCDAAFQRATGAGFKVVMPVSDMFWGDRYGAVE